jgi:hypothetical protein
MSEITDALTTTSDSPLNEPDDPIVRQLYDRWNRAQQHSKDWRTAAKSYYDMYAGDQWDADDRDKLREQDKVPVTFNRIAVIVDAVAGTEVNNRQEVRYIGRDVGDAKVNELLSGAGDWVRDECDAEDEESDSFQDLIICGMGWVDTRIAYDEDPDGKILVERVDPLEMYWDPGAKKKNLADRLWNTRIKKFAQGEAMARWPKLADEDVLQSFSQRAPWHAYDDDAGELSTHTYPQDAYDQGRDRNKNKYDDNTIYVAQYQYCEWEDVVQATVDGQPMKEIEEATFSEMEAEAERHGGLQNIGVESVRQKRRVWMQVFVAGDIILEDPQPIAMGDEEQGGTPLQGPSMHVMTGKRDRNNNVWHGLVKNISDPQRWANKFLSQILHIINTNAKGGLIVEDGVTDDHSKLESDWAASDSIVWVSDDAVRDGKLMPKPPPQIPPEMSSLLEFSVSSIRDTGGVNLEILGLADRNQPGVLEYSRKQSGITILSVFFDALRRYRKQQGRVMLHFITNFISDGRLIRVNNAMTGIEEYQQLWRDKEGIKYDTIVDEAATAPNQREKVFGVMMQILPSILQAGMPIPPEILDYLPLPSGLVAKWKEMVSQKDQPPSPEQQQQTQMMVEQIMAQIAKTKSETARNIADVDLKEANAAKAETEAGRSAAQEADLITQTAMRPLQSQQQGEQAQQGLDQGQQKLFQGQQQIDQTRNPLQ